VHRRPFDQPDLKIHTRIVEHPSITLQPANERGDVAVMNGPHHLLHDKGLPRSVRRHTDQVQPAMFDEVPDERQTTRPAVDPAAEFCILCDQSIQQE
jgi:hypothetical protein